MPRKKLANKTTTKKNTKTAISQEVKSRKYQDQSLFEKLQLDLQRNQSYLNLVLGALIIIVLGVLLFNYFNRPQGNLGPSAQNQNQNSGDVSKNNLPGKYTVKAGDTLFSIAQNYYNDGYKYAKIVEANKLVNANIIETGQVLDIPKLDQESLAKSSPSPDTSIEPSPTPTDQNIQNNEENKAGEDNSLIWGEKITTNTYTVQSGDWLSKIAGRAYGDVYSYTKIAQANNISDPDNIEVGTVLKIPR